jgi:hypothetical protein
VAAMLRPFFSALRLHLFRRSTVLALAGAFAFGLILARALGWLLPLPSPAASPPYAAIAASVVIDLAGLAVLLVWLPAAGSRREAWAGMAGWLGSALACGAALAGLSVSGVCKESLRTFLVLWGLMAGQGAVLAAIYGWLAVLFRSEPRLAAQAACLILSLAATALFWSREPIQLAGRSAAGGSLSGAGLAEAVLALSPPLAVASVWHQESDAARTGAARFDIVRGHLTYRVWIGEYRAVPYPQILASAGPGWARFGLVPVMLISGVLLLVLGDVAASFRRPVL